MCFVEKYPSKANRKENTNIAGRAGCGHVFKAVDTVCFLSSSGPRKNAPGTSWAEKQQKAIWRPDLLHLLGL
jgi:hypothetical protein